jgi:cobalt-zinc-cadmium efflux system outer membrane protein
MAVFLGSCLSGCLSTVRERVDLEICHKAQLPMDLPPRLPGKVESPPVAPGAPEQEYKLTKESLDNVSEKVIPAAVVAKLRPLQDKGFSTRAGFEQALGERLEKEELRRYQDRVLMFARGLSTMEVRVFDAGKDVPYSHIPYIKFVDPKAPEMERAKAVDRQFLPLGPLPAEVLPGPGPEGRPLTLNDLQKIALTNSPVIRQAAAAVEGAKGAAQQTRLYPNPSVGFSYANDIPSSDPIVGGFISGVIKGAGKIKTAFDAANVDVKNADLALRRAESDLRTSVRDGYFAVLSARENLRVNRALVKLTDKVYEVMTDQLKGGVAAVYETMQLRVTAMQTRIAYVQAHNRYQAAWKQLAAAIFRPDLPLTELAGRIDSPLPRYQYDKVLAHVLTYHSDALTAKMGIGKAQSLLKLAQLTPYPDFTYTFNLQQDHPPGAPGAPSKVLGTLSFGVPLPVFDRNQGGIRQAQASLIQAVEEPHRVRSALITSLSDAFERYENNRVQLEMYQKDILPNQIQAFRAVVQRHARGEVGQLMFTDLVTAEQGLVSVIGSYLGVLHDMWFAAVDIAALQQTPDLFQVDETIPVLPIPDLEQLCPLDCVHPCPVHPPAPRKGDGSWPRFEHAPAKRAGTESGTLPLPRVLPGKDGDPQEISLTLPVQAPLIPGVPAQGEAPLLMAPPAVESGSNRASLRWPVPQRSPVN